ncbi:MAG: serine hydrolase domain-containing protein [Parcubacteria group bacterium]
MANDERTIEFVRRIIEAWLPRKVKYERIPDFSIKASYKGKQVFEYYFGKKDKRLFPIASVTKLFTSLLLLKMSAEGRMSLNDKVGKYLKWVPKRKRYVGNATIKSLMLHRAGIARDMYRPYLSNLDFPNKLKGISNDELKKQVKGFKYSNLGYAILGEIIEKISGKSYFECLKAEILEPLGLNSIRLVSDKDATGFNLIDNNLVKEIGPTKVDAITSAFGLVSSIDDLHKFFGILCGEKKILGVNLATDVFKEFYLAEGDDKYGLGLWKITGDNGDFHLSDGRLFGNQVAGGIDRKNRLVITARANMRTVNIFAIVFGIMDVFHRVINYPEYHFGRAKNIANHDGVYRSVFGDSVLCGCGNKIFIFEPEVNDPLRDGMHVTFSRDEYRITSASRSSQVEELIDFYKDGRKEMLRIGAVEYEKIR